ncbi:MAG: hypothetical protein QW273_00995 [Candidatus Pacearchaeota archaeon]
MKFKKGQLTLFIIIGIIIIVLIFFIFLYKPSLNKRSSFNEVKEYYYSCIESIMMEGIDTMSSRGGYIYPPSFVAGSQFSPSSSELNFFGSPVPLWFYISGNNIAKEQVPTKSQMEEQLKMFFKENIGRCDFKEIENKGYQVYYSPVENLKIRINEENVEVEFVQRVSAYKGEESVVFSSHFIDIETKLGRFYNIAKKIYDYEKENQFLESYTLDILTRYAPFVGVEIKCSPIYFNFGEIRNNLSRAIMENLNYVNFRNKKDNYFSVDLKESIKENVKIMYQNTWPTKIEIYGDNIAQPIGNSKGLDILGFCYVPYKFVYDIFYPVLIQIYDDKEIFQFATLVVIEKNQPRERLFEALDFENEIDICSNSIQPITIKTYDLDKNPVEAEIKISCVGNGCFLGKTKKVSNVAVLETKVPQCVNAIIEANAEGYSPGKTIISTNEETEAEIVLKKKYKIEVELEGIKDKAIINFEGEGFSKSISYPTEKEVELVEDFYNISVLVFKNSTLKIPSYKEKKCFEMPSYGILDFKEETKCFEMTIPEQQIEGALIGGGYSNEYFFEEDLKKSKKIKIKVPLFKEPGNLEELSENYIKLEDSFLEVEIK